jgi:tellurite resistance protein TerC
MLIAFFAGCILLIIGLIALDLGVFHRRGHEHVVHMREALIWSAAWVSLALCFNVVVYFLYGHNWLGFRDTYASFLTHTEGHVIEPTGVAAAQAFLSGYLLELSLSMDNLFVFAAILAYFHVPRGQQHRVLVWGILGAIFLRGVMIGLGAALVHYFDWIFYVFGVLLVWTAYKMLKSGDKPIDPGRNIFIRIARKLYPTTTELHGNKFFVRLGDGALHMTPLFLALILVDIADVMFAIDSIPAIFGVTSDTFIVFTSNMFAVMGLRSMYFALIGLMHRFRYIKPAIVTLLAYIGFKMLFHQLIDIPNWVSLVVIFSVLASGVIISMLTDRPAKLAHGSGRSHEMAVSAEPGELAGKSRAR